MNLVVLAEFVELEAVFGDVLAALVAEKPVDVLAGGHDVHVVVPRGEPALVAAVAQQTAVGQEVVAAGLAHQLVGAPQDVERPVHLQLALPPAPLQLGQGLGPFLGLFFLFLRKLVFGGSRDHHLFGGTDCRGWSMCRFGRNRGMRAGRDQGRGDVAVIIVGAVEGLGRGLEQGARVGVVQGLLQLLPDVVLGM